ncbi:unnamed protein product [Amoebophrya sp. A120]|nr:unnamed protein product [Amoebophrya sp. A120]|eukprot:GSA120T00010134001.1
MKTMDFESRRRAFKQTQDLNDVRRKREDEEVQLRKTEKEVLLQKKRRDCRSDGCSTPAAPASTSTSCAAASSSTTETSMGSTSTHGNYNSAASRTTSNNSCASASNYTAQKILGQRNTLLSTTDEEHSSGAMNSKMSLNLNASASAHLQLQATDQHGAAVGNNINSPCVFRDHHDHGPPEDCSPLLQWFENATTAQLCKIVLQADDNGEIVEEGVTLPQFGNYPNSTGSTTSAIMGTMKTGDAASSGTVVPEINNKLVLTGTTKSASSSTGGSTTTVAPTSGTFIRHPPSNPHTPISKTRVKVLHAVTELRKRLSRPENPPIQEILDYGLQVAAAASKSSRNGTGVISGTTTTCGDHTVGSCTSNGNRNCPEQGLQYHGKNHCIRKMVTIMLNTDDHKLKFELAWTLTNIASGNSEHTNAVVESGGLEAFLQILNSRSALRSELCEQAIWALGNIAGDGPVLRDKLLERNAIKVLQNICSAVTQLQWNDKEKTDVLRNVMWLMSNLCRGKPSPPFEVVCPAFEVFAEVVGRNLDHDMTIDSMWGLSYLTQSTGDEQEDVRRAYALLLSGQAQRDYLEEHQPNLLIRCLLNIVRYGRKAGGAADTGPVVKDLTYDHASSTWKNEATQAEDFLLTHPALRVIGNLIQTPDHRYADICIQSGLLPALITLLKNYGGGGSTHRGAAPSPPGTATNPPCTTNGQQTTTRTNGGPVLAGVSSTSEQKNLQNGFRSISTGAENLNHDQQATIFNPQRNKAREKQLLKIQKEAVWVLSNIAAGSPHQVKLLVEPLKMLPQLCRCRCPETGKVYMQDVFDVIKDDFILPGLKPRVLMQEAGYVFANAVCSAAANNILVCIPTDYSAFNQQKEDHNFDHLQEPPFNGAGRNSCNYNMSNIHSGRTSTTIEPQEVVVHQGQHHHQNFLPDRSTTTTSSTSMLVVSSPVEVVDDYKQGRTSTTSTSSLSSTKTTSKREVPLIETLIFKKDCYRLISLVLKGEIKANRSTGSERLIQACLDAIMEGLKWDDLTRQLGEGKEDEMSAAKITGGRNYKSVKQIIEENGLIESVLHNVTDNTKEESESCRKATAILQRWFSSASGMSDGFDEEDNFLLQEDFENAIASSLFDTAMGTSNRSIAAASCEERVENDTIKMTGGIFGGGSSTSHPPPMAMATGQENFVFDFTEGRSTTGNNPGSCGANFNKAGQQVLVKDDPFALSRQHFSFGSGTT